MNYIDLALLMRLSRSSGILFANDIWDNLYNGHVRPPDITKHERTRTVDCELFHIEGYLLQNGF